jgi:tetratricopeptide (TPR) repeat protein
MNWKNYEKEILTYIQETFPETNISFDQKIIGRFSKVKRQIDILIESEVAGYEIKIIIDCKYFSRKIDVKQVESFCSMLEDVDAHQGVLITNKGYTKASINRAYYGNDKIELDIINFDDLHDYQTFATLPYVGHFSVIVSAPFGWVLDLKDRINSNATLHQRGITLKEAQKRQEWMYMQFWKIKSPDFAIEQLIEIQNTNILKIDPKTKFIYNSLVKRKDGLKTKIRIAEVNLYHAIEVTGFIQFKDYIFFIVLFTLKELLNKNLRKLQYILQVAKPCEINFNNHAVIEQSLVEIAELDDKQKKADKYYQVGIWFQEMDDFENALTNFKIAIECFPTHYFYLKSIIGKALSFGFVHESKRYAIQLFEIEPANPQVPQDLINIFLELEKPDILIELFKELIDKNEDPEILGNLNFHIGLLNFNLGNESEATSYMRIAKQYFKKVFPLDHQVFKSLTEFEQIKKRT